MVCYSADGTSGYLTKQGIADIKSGLAKEIFQNDLTELYQQQTQRRDTLNRDAQEVMRELLLRMEEGTVDNPRIEELMTHLADRLQFLSGKKQYGYLKAPLKAVVDEIVDEPVSYTHLAAPTGRIPLIQPHGPQHFQEPV